MESNKWWVAILLVGSASFSISTVARATGISDAISTSQEPATAVVGSSIADMATVTGLVSPSSSDTVTFDLYSSATTQNSSTLLFVDTQTVTLSGSTATATSLGYTAAATGTDYWVDTFNGDSNNMVVTSGATAEPVTITPNSPPPAAPEPSTTILLAAGLAGLLALGSRRRRLA